MSDNNFTLIIVESPAKCKKIESYLGPKYKCIASYGHLRELKGMEAIKIEQNFTPIFTEMPDKTTQINKIRALIKKADEVLLASDADREGEAIAWHICDMFKLPIEKTKRILFHEITEPAIKKAVLNPLQINMPLVHAQIARQILDLLVGYTLSPVLWKHITKHSKQGLSAGRCQTPALRLIYENQEEINAAIPESVYTVTGYFTSKNIPFILNSTLTNEGEMKAFLEQEINHQHEFTCGETRPIIKKPPKPFTTSTLQQAASNEMHISPKETMQICQKLYEAGYITYMRTDSMQYSDEFLKQTQAFIGKEYGNEYYSKPITDISTDSLKDAHEAIRPTNILCKEIDQNEHSSREMRMYKLIRNTTLASCMPCATYSGLTASISSSLEDKKCCYTYACEQLIFPGWKIVEKKDGDENNFSYLQTLKNKSVLMYKKITAKVSLKNMKQHYTEARLVHLLEEYGIGRPSTFSSLIEKIQERGYVLKANVEGKEIECVDFELVKAELTHLKNKRDFGGEKNKLIIQPTGIVVLEFLLDKFANLFDYAYTKQMEDALDLIARGEKVWHDLCRDCFNEINAILKDPTLFKKENNENNDDNFKITLDKHHDYIIGKYGPVIKCTKNKKITFKSIKPDIDLDKLRKGQYTLTELLVENKLTGKALGKYKENEVILKNGKFGLYIEWGECKQSIKQITKNSEEITLEDVLQFLQVESNAVAPNAVAPNAVANTVASANAVANTVVTNAVVTNGVEAEQLDLIANPILRKITDDLSIRTGKYGDYIFYKKKTMKNPKFLKLNGFGDDYKTCNLSLLKKWIIETYRLKNV